MKFGRYYLIDRPDLKLAIIAITRTAMNDTSICKKLVAEGKLRFECPVVLYETQGGNLFGPPNLTRAVAGIRPSKIPWLRDED